MLTAHAARHRRSPDEGGSSVRRDSDESGYLPYIDGLRAVAVLAVVAYHLERSAKVLEE